MKQNLKEILKDFSSEEILREICLRKDTYFENYYFQEHLERHGLLKQYHKAFITECDDGHYVNDALEEWKDKMTDAFTETIHEFLKETCQFDECKISLIETYTYAKYDMENGFVGEINIDAINRQDESIYFDLCDVFKPHQGNIKTYLEEKFQEMINDWF